MKYYLLVFSLIASTAMATPTRLEMRGGVTERISESMAFKRFLRSNYKMNIDAQNEDFDGYEVICVIVHDQPDPVDPRSRLHPMPGQLDTAACLRYHEFLLEAHERVERQARENKRALCEGHHGMSEEGLGKMIDVTDDQEWDVLPLNELRKFRQILQKEHREAFDYYLDSATRNIGTHIRNHTAATWAANGENGHQKVDEMCRSLFGENI